MKLATAYNGRPDGKLVIVDRGLTRAVEAEPIAATMQEALEHWTDVEPKLKRLSEELNSGKAPGAYELNVQALMAPLPRSWQWLDGSAFKSHGWLMQKVFNLPPIATDRPLMYQGVSDCFFPAHEDVPFPSVDDGIDFEGEFGVLVDKTPMGAQSEQAAEHIRLIVIINDWSLRVLAPIEMKTGFGWIQAKPPCSMAPIAVTPDELGKPGMHFEFICRCWSIGMASGLALRTAGRWHTVSMSL